MKLYFHLRHLLGLRLFLGRSQCKSSVGLFACLKILHVSDDRALARLLALPSMRARLTVDLPRLAFQYLSHLIFECICAFFLISHSLLVLADMQTSWPRTERRGSTRVGLDHCSTVSLIPCQSSHVMTFQSGRNTPDRNCDRSLTICKGSIQRAHLKRYRVPQKGCEAACIWAWS